MEQPKKKKKADPYKQLKYVAYRLVEGGKGFDGFVRFAKFQLCVLNKVLLKDPIWDRYTSEEILMEFFAHEFQLSKELRAEFEASLGDINGKIDEFAAWADKQIAEEEKIRKMTLDSTEDKITFDPGSVMGDET